MNYSLPLILIVLFATLAFANVKKKSENWYKPPLHSSWHWQLNGTLNTHRDVDVYIVDLFDTKISQIDTLHKAGRKVIGYFSAGSYEAWREDAKLFLKEDLGKKMDGWDERWLDIRSEKVQAIMIARLKEAKRKGFDGVEADNVDGYDNKTGFPLTAKDQLSFNIFLAKESHKLGLAIALKNDVDQIEALEPYFDFHINEECHAYDECDKVKPFLKAGKAVFNAEYSRKKHQKFCDGNPLGLNMLTLPLELDDSFRLECGCD